MILTTELLVYTPRKHHQKTQRQPVTLGNDQSQPLGIGPTNITCIFNPNSSSIPMLFPSKESSDLNIHVAIRKGIQNLTKNPRYPIAQYLSYDKLSHTYRAFT